MIWLISETKGSFWGTNISLIEAWLIYDLTYDVIWFRVRAETEKTQNGHLFVKIWKFWSHQFEDNFFSSFLMFIPLFI